MSLNIDDNEYLKLRASLSKMAEFVALTEVADEKYQARENALEQRWNYLEEKFALQLDQIRSVLDDFQKIMTAVGAERLRQNAQQLLKLSDENLQHIRVVTDDCMQKAEAIYKKIDKVGEFTIKSISSAANSVKAEDFQTVANDSIQRIQKVCTSSLRKVHEIIRWFHWRNIGLALSITIVVTMISGLYTNDEWPWESHQQVMQERGFAKAVISAWPHLSRLDQQEILQISNKTIS